MSQHMINIPNAYIIDRDAEGVTVLCPFCGHTHTHYVSGVVMAICQQGEYSMVEPPPVGVPAQNL